MFAVHEVVSKPSRPPSGMTATGSPSSGTTKNQGRAGMLQAFWVAKPVRYLKLDSALTKTASSSASRMSARTRSILFSNSAFANGSSFSSGFRPTISPSTICN